MATAHAQTSGAGLQLTTVEHLQGDDWWPTKSTLPLKSFAGSAACVRCHAEVAGGMTSMQRAASRPADTNFAPRAGGSLVAASLVYSLSHEGDVLNYTVAKGTEKITHPVDWVMGAGELGRTFLYRADDRWLQSEATYYTAISALDITTGLSFDSAVDLPHALGQPLSSADARSCFGCHTVHATTASGFNPAHAEAGIGCEACHGPGLSHVTTALRTSHSSVNATEAIFNPAKLSPADSIDFCGSCHRTFADAALVLGGKQSTAAVRFQPYRLEESKCWRATQSEKLTCVSCHNPHEPLSHEASIYDRRCLSCHAPHAAGDQGTKSVAAGKTCPKSTKNCTSCHMPKVDVSSMHGQFTDHFIRVVRPGDAFPK